MSEVIEQVIEISELAKQKIEEIVKKEPQGGKSLRFGVTGIRINENKAFTLESILKVYSSTL